jgi:uncharacterized membrane protein (Fun14 family)
MTDQVLVGLILGLFAGWALGMLITVIVLILWDKYEERKRRWR